MGITRQQALDCFASHDLIGIGMEADAVRRRVHPEGVVSYSLDGTVDLWAQERTFASEESDVRLQQISESVRDVLEAGGTGVKLMGNSVAPLGVEVVAEAIRAIKQQFPHAGLSGFSATEVLAMAMHSQRAVRDTLLQLRDAGLDLLAGEDAEILDDSVRQGSAGALCTAEGWIRVHRTAHQVGLRSVATMRFGAGETQEQRVAHLQVLQNLQEETGGFTAFVPRTFKPGSAAAAGQALDEATSVEFLKTLAVCRMMLDNIRNLQSSWATQGLKVLQMGLRFGSNDVGTLRADDRAETAAAKAKSTSEEELRRVIRDAGFKPVQRDTLYRTMFLS